MAACAITMVRDDDFFLRKWVDYYGKEFGRDNLYVFFDGTDQTIPAFCKDIHTQLVEHQSLERLQGDKARIHFLNQQAASLFQQYDIVVATDVDEFLVVDPVLHTSLLQFLSAIPNRWTVSGLGIDVGQHPVNEGVIDDTKPFLQQRSYGLISSRYTKASVLFRPAEWGSGFHRVKGHNYHIVKGLYLFHFGCVDLQRMAERAQQAERLDNGWEKHSQRRAKTNRIIGKKKPKAWTWTIAFACAIQTIFRPLYALNKPSMLGLRWVVKIPQRLCSIL